MWGAGRRIHEHIMGLWQQQASTGTFEPEVDATTLKCKAQLPWWQGVAMHVGRAATGAQAPHPKHTAAAEISAAGSGQTTTAAADEYANAAAAEQAAGLEAMAAGAKEQAAAVDQGGAKQAATAEGKAAGSGEKAAAAGAQAAKFGSAAEAANSVAGGEDPEEDAEE